MRRVIVVGAAGLVLALGGVGFGTAQDATPETNVLGTPCPTSSPQAMASPIASPMAMAEGTPMATPEGTPIVLEGCPTVGAGTPSS